MREFSTDRPDLTESPFTVDAGHVQLEMDFARVTRNRVDGERERTSEFAPLNLRLGVRNDFELGLFLSPYTRLRTTPRVGPSETHSGFGDVGLRAKWNFTGNDPAPGSESAPAFGLIADLTLPTSADGLGADRVEGALTLPVAFEWPGGWEGGAMTQLQFRHDSAEGYQTVWVNTATVGHELVKNVSGYVELAVETGSGAAVTSFSFGATWMLRPNLQLDAGGVIGLSHAADDLQFFAGISRRF